MTLEHDIQLFWEAYGPILEAIKQESLSEAELEKMFERLYLPDSWEMVSARMFAEAYEAAAEFREEDGEGKPLEIAIAIQQRKSRERTKWMDEVIRIQGLSLVREDSYLDDHLVRYVSIPVGEDNLKFVLPYGSSKGILIFDEPITREWGKRAFLNNSYFDMPDGRICASFEMLEGTYVSASLKGKIDKSRGKLFEPKPVPAIKLKLAYTGEERVPRIMRASFDLDRLGEGELDNFLKYVGFA